MTGRMSREERDAQRKRDIRESEQRATMREMMAAMAPALAALHRLGVMVGDIERIRPDGSCALGLIVDERVLAHSDKSVELDRKLQFVSAISAMRDHFLEMARRRRIILPFSFFIQDRDGTVTREDIVQ